MYVAAALQVTVPGLRRKSGPSKHNATLGNPSLPLPFKIQEDSGGAKGVLEGAIAPITYDNIF
jgi:hypothetical protein